MTEQLHQIIYISTATESLTEEALLELLAASQKRNASRQITGLLLHFDGNIIQIIEGPEASVKALYETIAKDTRHVGVTQMSSKPIQTRDFPEYKMGFKRTNPQCVREHIPGFTDLVEKGRVNQGELEGLSKLVATFIKTFAKTTQFERFV